MKFERKLNLTNTAFGAEHYDELSKSIMTEKDLELEQSMIVPKMKNRLLIKQIRNGRPLVDQLIEIRRMILICFSNPSDHIAEIKKQIKTLNERP